MGDSNQEKATNATNNNNHNNNNNNDETTSKTNTNVERFHLLFGKYILHIINIYYNIYLCVVHISYKILL